MKMLLVDWRICVCLCGVVHCLSIGSRRRCVRCVVAQHLREWNLCHQSGHCVCEWHLYMLTSCAKSNNVYRVALSTFTCLAGGVSALWPEQ